MPLVYRRVVPLLAFVLGLLITSSFYGIYIYIKTKNYRPPSDVCWMGSFKYNVIYLSYDIEGVSQKEIRNRDTTKKTKRDSSATTSNSEAVQLSTTGEGQENSLKVENDQENGHENGHEIQTRSTEVMPAEIPKLTLERSKMNVGIQNDIKKCVDSGFNIIILAFLQGSTWPGQVEAKPVDAFIEWNKLTPIQKYDSINYVHSEGAKILLSIGGAKDHIDGTWGNRHGMDLEYGLIFKGVEKAKEYAELAANAVLDNNFDGLDFDLELHPGNYLPFREGHMNTFLEETHKRAREMLPMDERYIISHTPMAPYVSVWGGDGSYLKFILNFQDEIDFISLQYYNQGFYTSYETTFESTSGSWAEGSAIKELKDAGVKMSKLVVGKPTSTSSGSSGYTRPGVLNEYGCKAKQEIGFVGGFMTWMYQSSRSAESVEWANGLRKLCDGDVAPICTIET